MRYEKKMIILTGEGKGVVLIEKSGLGVKFALRTFGIKKRHGIKIGIVTPKRVTVRDIEVCDDPSAVFYLDDVDTDALHFALFDTDIILYGTTTKPMWESNLFDLLNKHAQPVRIEPSPKVLPPIAAAPEALPLPDGTGIPQSRACLYGDDALAADDFYTPLDLSSRMPEVDRFLDSPRMLDGLAPTLSAPQPQQPRPKRRADDPPVTAPSVTSTEPQNAEPQSDAVTVPTVPIDAEVAAPDADIEPTETLEPLAAPVAIEPSEIPVEDAPSDVPVATKPSDAPKHIEPTGDDIKNAVDAAGTEGEPAVEQRAEVAAAVAESGDAASESERVAETPRELPWESAARWLRSRATREIAARTAAAAAKIEPKSEIRHVRESTFFERSRQDVEKLFAHGAKNTELAALMPDIEWVSVKFDGHTVSVGRGGDVFLCYAVAGEYEKVSPLGAEAQWLPKLKTAPTGKGYWLIFQDLKTGEILKAAAE